MQSTNLPANVSISDLAALKGCTDRTVRDRIQKNKLPQTTEIRPGVQGWNRSDLEPFLAAWHFSPTGERVRRAFGKPPPSVLGA